MLARKTPDDPRDPRGLVRASALVVADGRTATQHLVYDLSVTGVRLCGLPGAEIGDAVEISLSLPQLRVHVFGRLRRVGTTAGRPDFAIEFDRLPASSEDIIHDAVLHALLHEEQRPSVLLFREESDEHLAGWGWLGPIFPICALATQPSLAVECLESHPIELGILSAGERRTCLPDWAAAYPEIRWQSLDESGCLHPLADPDPAARVRRST